ncbi:hypothetical protein C8R47DRAFT_1083453 [Mycena vitilis]|nr:hypothetical protein C8R47DRAFT_1083453 [Mycena vitilis]
MNLLARQGFGGRRMFSNLSGGGRPNRRLRRKPSGKGPLKPNPKPKDAPIAPNAALASRKRAASNTAQDDRDPKTRKTGGKDSDRDDAAVGEEVGEAEDDQQLGHDDDDNLAALTAAGDSEGAEGCLVKLYQEVMSRAMIVTFLTHHLFRLVPKAEKAFETVSRSSPVPSKVRARSKREITRDQEFWAMMQRPLWNDNVASPTASSGKASARKIPAQRVNSPLGPVKLEPQENALRVSAPLPSIIIIDSSDVEFVEASDIDVVYLFKHFFPSTEEKNIFTLDALVNAAHSLQVEDIKKRLLTDPDYVDSLAPVCKIPSDVTVVTNYALKTNVEARVQFLLEGMRYIYAGAIDGEPGVRIPLLNDADVIQKGTAYTSEGFKATILNAFFRGTPSLGQKYASLWRNKVPKSMVAIGGTASRQPSG